MNNRLIIMDDDPTQRAIFGAMAENSGYTVRATGNVAEFEALVHDWRPTVIILDLNMPEADGVELLRHLAGTDCKATILLASSVDPRVLRTARDVGAGLLLQMGETFSKTVHPDELRTILEKYKAFAALTEAHVLEGLQQDQLTLHFQPIIELGSSEAVGCEALIRWEHPAQGLLHPDRFIPVIEERGGIDTLTNWVMVAAVQQIATWQAAGIDLFVSINLSAHNLHDTTLPDRLSRCCADHGVEPDRLWLELTETAVMDDPVKLLEVLTRLRIKGFRLAIDDFGTGYSSLMQLRRLPFSELKIDKSFVLDMMSSEDARVIVEATVALAHKLNLEVVAEGVETPEVAAVLTSLGVERGQGFHFSRALPPEPLRQWLFWHNRKRQHTSSTGTSGLGPAPMNEGLDPNLKRTGF